MTVERLPIASLSFDPANARKHPDRNLEAIKSSLRRFGQQKPIVIDSSNVVRAGNGTMAAAKALGWNEIDAVRSDLPLAELTAFAIADNRTAELAEWDEEILAGVLSDPDIGDVGFDESEIAALDARINPVEVVEDEVPSDVPERCKAGDLWQLGEHRLLCGDSTKAEDVKRLTDGTKVDLLLTDPPYNVAYVGKTKDALTIANDSMDDGAFREFLASAFQNAFDAMKPGASYYIWHADSEGYNFRGAVRDCGQAVRQCLIWKKQTMVMGRQDYHWKHEPCLYGWKSGAAHGWYADRKQTTVLEFDRPSSSEDHPTMKPVALFAYQMGNNTMPQGVVLDPFLGSGTTIIAAEQLGRRCYGLELMPNYCDIILARWEKLTGKKAERISASETTPATAEVVSGEAG